MRPTLLLVSSTGWPSAARLAAAFSRLDWRVELLAPSDSLATTSRFIDARHDYSAFTPLSTLRHAIRASGPDFMIPCDDRAVRQMLTLGRRDEQLADLIARSLGAPRAYPNLMSRAGLIAAAQADGIRVPPARAIADETDLEAGLSRFGLPVVLKSDGSWGGDGVAIVHTRAEALAAFRRLSRPVSPLRGLARAMRRRDPHHLADAIAPVRPVVSMQSFVPGTPATTAVACWQGEVLGAIHADVVASNGKTGPACVVRRCRDAEMEAAAAKLARRFGLSGLHGLDFIRDGAGKVHLLEINPRATQTAALAFGDGGDLVAALSARIAGRPSRARRPVIEADTVALFPQEWRRDPASPYLSMAHHDVPWDDPGLLRAATEPVRRVQPWKWLGTARPEWAPLRPGNQQAIASDR